MIGKLLSEFAQWLKDTLVWLGQKIFELIMDAAATIIESIPVPSFFGNASNYLGSISAEVGYWLGPFELTYGVSVILSAFGLRFIIRRLPFIG